MAETQRLQFIIDAVDNTKKAVDSVKNNLENAKSSLEGMSESFKKIRNVGAVAFAGLSAIAGTSLKAFSDAEADIAVATQTLTNAFDEVEGGIEGLTDKSKGGISMFAQLKGAMDSAGQAAAKLGFDDEEASKSFAKLVQVTKSTVTAQSDLKLAMDLSRMSGQSLESATSAIIKVHAGGTKILKEFGIQVEEGTTATEALAMIQEKAGGTAEVFANTTKGAMQIMAVSVGNLRETIGGALAPAFSELIAKITPVIDKITTWASENPKLVATLFKIGFAVSALAIALGTIGIVLPAIIAGFGFLVSPIGAVVVLIAALGVLGGVLASKWDAMKEKIVNVWEKIKNAFEDAKTKVDTVIDGIKTKIKEFADEFGRKIIIIASAITGLYLPTLAKMAVQTIVSLAKMAASWIANTAVVVAQATIQAVTAIPGLIAKYAVMAATAVATGAKVVAQWVLMSLASVVNAVKMAAAWLIAFGPIAWVIALIGALVAAVILNWETIKNFVLTKFTEISMAIVAFWENVKATFISAIEAVKMFFVNMFLAIWEQFTTALENIKAFFIAIGQFVIALWTGMWQSIIQFSTMIVTAVVDWATNIVDNIKSAFTAVKDFFVDIWNTITNTVKKAIDKIKQWLDPVIKLVERLIGGLKSIASLIGGGKDKKGGDGKKPKKVNDAIISPTGKVIETDPMDYLIATKTPGALAGAGAGGITINITGNSFMGKERIAEEIGNKILKIVKSNMRI